jgi:hypothetical protein
LLCPARNTGSPTYSTKANVLTITNSAANFSDMITVSYVDSLQGLWTDSSSDGSTGSGSYVFLKSWKPSDIAGKTLSLTGAIGECGGVPLQLVIDAAGANYTVNCQGAAQKGNGTIAADASLPGVLAFTDSSSGSVYYLGLVAGSTVASGSVAVVENNASNGKTNVGGITGLTSK